IDGDFGGGTDSAVRSFQVDRGDKASGRVDPVAWQAITGMPWPQLFERCLQLTARFEGHGYKLIAGNFDGAGLTWGIIGFTLKHGVVQAIVSEVAARAPQLLVAAFGQRADELVETFRTLKGAALLEWADSVSTGARKQTVIEPWRSGFAQLGGEPLVQEIQRRRAREQYYDEAMATAVRLGSRAERDVALCFDIHVQNGGVKAADQAAYRDAVAKSNGPKTAAGRREVLALLVADSANRKYRADVLSRKSAIAVGQGVVHQQLFVLDNWGFASD
ncbi:MAG TPA: peptidoglycan-binding domain-containing protein, partial [Gammaproteobacteria bacterium]|nr:peptidoglycan-binding domain-containing protein [Gammaproteobacteria bacterium]